MPQNGTPVGTPPKGSYSDGAPQLPFDRLVQQTVGGDVKPPPDPAFPPPGLKLDASTAAQAFRIYRDLPIVTIQNNWQVSQVRSALAAHMEGQFELSSELIDSVLGDDRVQATLGSRLAGLFGREMRFRPANDSDAARECMDAWVKTWPDSFDHGIPEVHAYSILAGIWPGQLVWNTSGPIWTWQLRPWHMRYVYYHWGVWRYVALTQDGGVVIEPGNGKWVLHAPRGEYRGWVHGAVRAIAEPWLIRHFAIRDWARFSEVHGLPIRKGIAPASGDPDERAAFQSALANLGSETTLLCSEGHDAKNGGNRYDLELVEAKDTAWEAFPGLRDHCDMAIVLALRFQNLTTEIQSGGSYAAAAQHGQVAVQQESNDNAGWKTTIRNQIAKPFAYLNFGDAELAPYTDWDVRAIDASKEAAEMFSKFGLAIEVLRRGGVEFKDVEELRRFASKQFDLEGLPDFNIVEPTSGGLGSK